MPPCTVNSRWPSAAELAQQFHETYERLAPAFGYQTREASANPWTEIPAHHRALMIAVCAEVLETLPPAKKPDAQPKEI